MRSVFVFLFLFRGLAFVEFLFPLGGFVGFFPGGVEVDQALQSFGGSLFGSGGDFLGGGGRLQAVVGGQEQRFGVGEFSLAGEVRAEQAFRVERGPLGGLSLLADRQALAEFRLGRLELLRVEQRLANSITASACDPIRLLAPAFF